MGKKRKQEENGVDSVNLGPKRVKNEEDVPVHQVNNISINDGDGGRFKFFLIKKPIGVGIEELAGLKWTGEEEEVLAKRKLKTETGNFRILVAPKAKKERMVYIPALEREREDSDAKNMKADGYISGSITILPSEVKQKTLGGSIYEEGEEIDKNSVEIHPKLKKIKKTAILELETRQERNKAYGNPTDSHGNPKKLIDIVKN